MNLFFICIATRVSIAYLAFCFYNHPLFWLLSIPLFFTSLTWIIMYIFKLRKYGCEVGLIWWAPHRIYHSLLFLAASLLVLHKPGYTFVPLSLDVILGTMLFIDHYIT